jgi:hypothetical protein
MVDKKSRIRIRIKEFKFFTQKNVCKKVLKNNFRDVHPGSWIWIFFHPRSRIQRSRSTGSLIPDPDPQHCHQVGANKGAKTLISLLFIYCILYVGKFATGHRRMGKVSGMRGTLATSPPDLTAEPPSGLSTASSRRVVLLISLLMTDS